MLSERHINDDDDYDDDDYDDDDYDDDDYDDDDYDDDDDDYDDDDDDDDDDEGESLDEQLYIVHGCVKNLVNTSRGLTRAMKMGEGINENFWPCSLRFCHSIPTPIFSSILRKSQAPSGQKWGQFLPRLPVATPLNTSSIITVKNKDLFSIEIEKLIDAQAGAYF